MRFFCCLNDTITREAKPQNIGVHNINMNCASYHPSKHQPVNDCRGVGAASSTTPQTPASVEALEAKISSLKMLRVRDSFDQRSPPVSHSNSTAAVAYGAIIGMISMWGNGDLGDSHFGGSSFWGFPFWGPRSV